MWAPHPLYWQGRFLLFYAGRQVSDGSMAIGVASSASPRGPFRDLGRPLLTRSKGQPTYTAIDPFVLADKGTLWLYWGSNDEPIRVARLNASATRVVGPTTELVQPVPEHGRYGGLVEGAWVLPHDGWFYLFYSVGDCCSENANYSVFVARSKAPNGPFRPGPHNPVLHGNSHFWAVGHNATARDDAGHDWLVYHARSRASVSDDRLLMLDRIVWHAGWPTVADDTGASWAPQPVPEVASR
jgi:arabinan endo-1,5-alpha-L-arabinosidase